MAVNNEILQVAAEHSGLRLDQYLAQILPNFSRAYLQKKIAESQVLLNDKPARKGDHVTSGDQIRIIELLEKSERRPPSNSELAITVVYEDDWLAVIEKPAGLATHPVNHEETQTIANWWISRNPGILETAADPLRPGIVHRLDTNTSGLLILARNQEVVERMQSEFKERNVRKEYLALVYGEAPAEGAVDFPIAHDPKSKRRMIAVKDRRAFEKLKARTARTEFTRERQFHGYTLLRVRTKTGRMHQVRVHLSAIGHSLVGDVVYRVLPKGNQTKMPAVELHRHFLHACRLEFKHPFTNEPKEFVSALPPELQQVLDKLD